jgi:protein ImuA
MSYSLPSKAQAMRAQLSLLEAAATRPTLPFGDARIDQRLPGGGLPLGCWHEAGGEGLEIETAVAAAAFVAALAAPLAETGDVVWVMRRDDLYAPGLAGLGFPAERLIQVCVKDQAAALRVLEEALTSPGVATAIGEAEVPDLVAGRRLQLACEIRGATGFLIRRRMFGSASQAHGSTAMSRWKIASTPSEPRAGEPGLGAPRWRVDLERCRGGRPGAWIMEKTDGPLPLRVVAELGDRQLAPPLSRVG